MTPNTFQQLIVKIGRSYLQLQASLQSSTDFEDFMNQLGWDINVIPTPISNLSSYLTQLQNHLVPVDNNSATASDYVLISADVVSLYNAINNLSGADFSAYPTLGSSFTTIFPTQLNDSLIIGFFKKYYPTISSVLQLIGIFNIEYVKGTNERPSHYFCEILWQNFTNIISDPKSVINNIFDWDMGVNVPKLHSYIRDFAESIPIISQDVPIDYRVAQKLEEDNTLTASNARGVLALIFNLVSSGGSLLATGVAIEFLPPKTGVLPGIALMPFVKGGYAVKLHLFDSVYLLISADIDLSNELAVLIRPGQPIKVITNLLPTGTALAMPEGSLRVGLSNEDESGAPIMLFGSPDSTHLQYKALSLTLGLDISTSGQKDLFAELQLTKGLLQIKLNDGDNFLKSIFPADGIGVDFEFVIGYSLTKGFYFKGGVGLEIEIPIHKSLLGVEFESLLLSLVAKPDGTIPISAAISFNIKAGPLVVSVKNVGLKANMSFPSGGGNAGPVDFQLGFRAPTGVGIAIDADPVSGGGFLNYDENTFTYTGGLELNFSKISLKAIGILTTKMPDGGGGFSLLVIITAEFTPIQIGMGFTLNGVGGLLGLNRTMNVDRLRTGIKDNSLDTILFPQDIVKNANVIISNISQAFPLKRDRFLIGPMAKIGWGTPTLLTIELGIIIELPSPVVIAIVGVIKALLPSENNRIIGIQVNFLGVIDFGKKYLSFDASLYDSNILFFKLFGDMALRVYWGDKPNFLLSVGGFHPKFTPPPMNLPQMQRLAIELSNSNSLKIRIETYFSVTSNSAQFGARLEARAKAWKIEAVGALWFDILFQFSPFYFNADMGAMFAIKMGSRELLSIYVDLSLEGPNPWRAQGKASFKVLGIRVHVSFDKTFGQERIAAVEMAELLSKFTEAIQSKDNWEVLGPDRSHQTVSFRQLPDGNTDLVIDPFGALKFSQRLVPLNISLSKYGTAKISDNNKFTVTSLQLKDPNNNTQNLTPATVQDYFARNEFFYMSDDEKLSKDSYERFDSGFSIGSTDEIFITSSAFTTLDCAFEEITIDTRPTIRFRDAYLNAYVLNDAVFALQASNNYVSNSKLSNSAARPISGGPAATKVQMEEYYVMDRNTMQPVTSFGLEASYKNATAAGNALNNVMSSNPSAAANLLIVNTFEL